MATDTQVNNLVINVLSKSQYDGITNKSNTELYLVPDETDTVPTSGSANTITSGGVYTALSGKQDTLVSGTNIKTVNNESLLGSGNVTITGSGETNVIEAVTFNGVAATITNKTAAITATIPSEVTESTVSGWGFTKNTGTLTAETDPIFSASAAAGITSSDITNWNGKTNNTGTVTGVKMNGTTNNPTSGVVDLGTVITSETSLSKGTGSGSGNAVTDISVSGHEITLTKGSTFLTSHQDIKTINSQTITGTGNITINELPSVTSSDNGKILRVVNGAWALTAVSTITTGTSAPSNSNGNNGDIYLQTS